MYVRRRAELEARRLREEEERKRLEEERRKKQEQEEADRKLAVRENLYCGWLTCYVFTIRLQQRIIKPVVTGFFFL